MPLLVLVSHRPPSFVFSQTTLNAVVGVNFPSVAVVCVERGRPDKRHLRKHTEENSYEFQKSQKRSLNKSTTFLWLHKCFISNGLRAFGSGYYER